SAIAVCLGAAGCDCGAGQLVSTPDPHTQNPTKPTVSTPATSNPPGWCSSDCDCPTGSVCLSGMGEPSQNSCQPGTNTCPRPCTVSCGAGTTCQNGVCVTAPCVGSSCTMTTMPPGGVTVAGTYNTFYAFDIHDFAQKAAEISALLDVLNAA